MTKVTRRAVCAGLAIAPVAIAIGPQASVATGFETTAATIPPKDIFTRIIETVAAEHSLSPVVVLSSVRTRDAVAARQKGLYLAYRLSGKSLPEIGRRFGGRDHTTVLHAVRKLEAMAEADPSFRAHLLHLARKVDRDADALFAKSEACMTRQRIASRSAT
jgi:hypothetical protein